MIKVGIHENLVLAKTILNDKGSLVLGFKQVSDADPLAVFNSAAISSSSTVENDFLIYPPRVTDFEGNVDTQENILRKIGEVRDLLTYIMHQYMTSDKIVWDIFEGADVTPENLYTKIKNQDTLNLIYGNIVKQFIDAMTPFVGENGKKFRMIFVRKSKASNFPTLRRKFLDTQGFMEPMSIPAAQTKLAFTKYEKENGLDKADALIADAAPSASVSADVDALLNG